MTLSGKARTKKTKRKKKHLLAISSRHENSAPELFNFKWEIRDKMRKSGQITISILVPFETTNFIIYRISSYSFRGNYSFLNLTLCTVTFGDST